MSQNALFMSANEFFCTIVDYVLTHNENRPYALYVSARTVRHEDLDTWCSRVIFKVDQSKITKGRLAAYLESCWLADNPSEEVPPYMLCFYPADRTNRDLMYN